MKQARTFGFLAATALLLALPVASARAEDTLKLAIGQRGNWDTAITELGQRAGIFKKHGIVLDMLYTSGGGETQQAVISGSVDVGTAAGVMGVLSAFSKGAPVRILGAQATGAADFWYARTNSGINSLKDTDGKTIAYSTNGSSTHSIVLAFMKEFGLKAKPTATGSPSSTLTQVMSGQIDVGWSSPPFGFKQMDEGAIKIVGRANDAPLVRGQTIRLVITNPDTLAKRKDALVRFMDAYREAIDYMYGDNPQVIKDYAEFAGVSEAVAKRVRDEFFVKSLLDPDEIKGIDQIVPEAVTLKYTAAPLTKEQLAELIQIPPRKK
jgi:NitT/TauT family transport system substrate-binding protein